jgi:hypothetical protein
VRLNARRAGGEVAPTDEDEQLIGIGFILRHGFSHKLNPVKQTERLQGKVLKHKLNKEFVRYQNFGNPQKVITVKG